MKKINKTLARMRWNAGESFVIAPNKCRPVSMFAFRIDPDELRSEVETFDAMVNAFIYYNCHGELGSYPCYYVDDDTEE